jgi:aspartyl-tRNA(Asn)/glutamyl-tRNA(Gln) amidotransferase subunit A
VSVAELARRIRAGQLSPREAVESSLDRIERLDGALNAFIAVRGERALAEAEQAPQGPLRGVPVAVKDVIDVAGERTTAASKILADHVAERDAACVERLRRAGAIVIGKLNTHEFAFGASTTSLQFGPAHNPWSLDRICGGSSGGSGAAAAADLVAATLGTDTAGSIRIPACFCGVTGLRPTQDLVPVDGVVPVSWSLDTVGPIARSAEDCALVLSVLTGRPYELGEGADGLRIGVVERLFEQADPAVAAQVRAAVDELGFLGGSTEPVEVPMLDDAGTINQLVMLPEAAEAHLPWLRRRLADYGADVRARLLAGLLLPATAHVTGLRAKRWYSAELDRVFEHVDLLAAPEMPVVAPPIDQDDVELHGQRVPYRLSLIPFNSPWSLPGLPVVSVPAGFVDGLPVGLALVGRRFEEATMLRAAHSLQQATDWHERRPPVPFDGSRDGAPPREGLTASPKRAAGGR